MSNSDALTPDEQAAFTAADGALGKGTIRFDHPGGLLDELQGISSGVAFDRMPPIPTGGLPSRPEVGRDGAPREAVPLVGLQPKSRPEWLLGMSDDFRKAATSIDRKLQGRLLEAITHILTEPLTSRGDTVKPLNADMKGLWRYRIGDFRLVYHPDPSNRRILLVSFTTRTNAYA